MGQEYLKRKRILLVDDEKELLDMVYSILKEEGYSSIRTASTQKEAVETARSFHPELAVLDVMLPDGNGFSLFEKLREMEDYPVLFLTACGEDEDKFKGLGLGADDYLVKPFAFDEFSARVRALLRRGSDTKSAILSLADLTLNTTNREITRGERNIKLTSTEYALLEYLLRNQGHVLTRSQIADHVWNYDFEYDSNVVDVYIRYLRNKIDRDFPVKLIHTIRGTGYVMRVES